MKIGQFCFFRLSSPSEHPYGSEKYGSRYQGQRGPTPSRVLPELPPHPDLSATPPATGPHRGLGHTRVALIGAVWLGCPKLGHPHHLCPRSSDEANPRRAHPHQGGRGHPPGRRPHRLQHRIHQRRPTPPPSRRRPPRADADAFPVTIEHAFGETTIEAEPTRVATLGWTDHDHALALGVVPVGATKITWGGNEAGSTDWFDAAVEEAGAEAPVRYDDADGAPIDEVAELAPDLILATNSGITEAEYAKLSKIAPGRRLPRGAVDHRLADLARDGRRGAGPHRPGRRGRGRDRGHDRRGQGRPTPSSRAPS